MKTKLLKRLRKKALGYYDLKCDKFNGVEMWYICKSSDIGWIFEFKNSVDATNKLKDLIHKYVSKEAYDMRSKLKAKELKQNLIKILNG